MSLSEIQQQQRSTLIGYTATYAVWGGALTALMALIGAEAPPPRVALLSTAILTVVSGAIWAYFLIRLVWRARSLKNAQMRHALNDERTQVNSTRAFAVSFWGVLAAAAVAVVAIVQFEMELAPIAMAIGMIWIGVTVALTAYLIFDGRDEA
ncbi:MAG: hypothetical protein AAGD92_03780 [Pseudomonadota bacterium]